MQEIAITMQTAYADLRDRCATAAFEDAFAEQGTFVSKKTNGRTYWYFQTSSENGRTQKYVGSETPELLDRIAHHREVKSDEQDRRRIVASLVQSAYLPAPQKKLGDVIGALAQAGVFRLRAVLVGTSAYQTYSALLGYRLPLASMQTGDVDIAQYLTVSVAVEDETPPMLEVLQAIDASFRAVPHVHDGRRSINYETASGVRVDFLTPNEGAETDEPQKLPALNTDGEPLRFLDFLIHQPEQAVVLHANGIFVNVPSPTRFAIHKLIVAQRRRQGDVKKTKDIMQAEALLQILTQDHRRNLKLVWDEAWVRGKKWRTLLSEGLAELESETRDRFLQAVDETRAIVPGLDLKFFAPQARYDFDRGVVTVLGDVNGKRFRCSISDEALEDEFVNDVPDGTGFLKTFRENRDVIEGMMREKYLNHPIDQINEVLIKSDDISGLRKSLTR